MPSRPPQDAVRDFDEVFGGYGQSEAVREARRALAIPLDWDAARAACPFGVDLRGLAQRLAEGDWAGARRAVEVGHPWPGVLGRCCHAFCEHALADGGVARSEVPYLSALERAVGDHTEAASWAPTQARPHRIAVVGAGSAGLGCAYALRRLGYGVTLFDRLTVPGGKLITGYPPFRMSKAVVRRETDPTVWGVEWRGGTQIGRAEMERLRAAFDAVFLGVGAVRSNPLRVGGASCLEGFLQAEAFLESCWLRGSPLPLAGRRAVVVGGGYTALDVARTVLRLQGEAHMVYRRGREDVPLRPSNRERLLGRLSAEGVRLSWHLTPVAARRGPNGRGELVCRSTGPEGLPDEVVVPCDVLITATGSTVDLSGLFAPPVRAALSARDDPYGAVEVDPVTRMTSVPRLWAGGDVIDSRGNDGAFLDGMVAARSMDAFLRDDLDTWVEANRPWTRRLAGHED